MRVYNMRSPRTGNPVANQFIIMDDEGSDFFQSYQSIIAKRDSNGKIFLDDNYWNYSRTTAKYRKEWVESELENVWQDQKFITHVLREYFWNNVKNLSNEEFKQFLIEHGWDLDNEE